MKNKIITLLVGLVCICAVQAQSELENKYWTYRDRYRNYFTKVGGEAGESQSAASIKELAAKSLNYRIVNGQERVPNAASLASPPTTAGGLPRYVAPTALDIHVGGIFY